LGFPAQCTSRSFAPVPGAQDDRVRGVSSRAPRVHCDPDRRGVIPSAARDLLWASPRSAQADPSPPLPGAQDDWVRDVSPRAPGGSPRPGPKRCHPERQGLTAARTEAMSSRVQRGICFGLPRAVHKQILRPRCRGLRMTGLGVCHRERQEGHRGADRSGVIPSAKGSPRPGPKRCHPERSEGSAVDTACCLLGQGAAKAS